MYKSFKHLYISTKCKEAIYLGYRINLTKTEYAILCALMENPKKPLIQANICELVGLKKGGKTIPYHIHKINSKAKCIGNRILIKNKAKFGYFLNEKM